MKTCNKCGLEKEESLFLKNKNTCKECKIYSTENKIAFDEKAKLYCSANFDEISADNDKEIKMCKHKHSIENRKEPPAKVEKVVTAAKTCSKCGIEKDNSFYLENKKICSDCRSVYGKAYSISHKTEISANKKVYGKKNAVAISDKNKIHYQENKEYYARYGKQYRADNKEELRVSKNAYTKTRRATDHAFNLKCLVSRSVNAAIKRNGGNKNGGSILDNLPCDIQKLKQHLENQFEPWMNWDNQGMYVKATWDPNDQSTWTWQIDHEKPHSDFHYTTMDCQEFRDCWALSNLRPLRADLNQRDGATRVRHKKR